MDRLNAENLSPERKKIFSDTAKKTSARREIQLQRAERLKAWREREPKKFLAIVDKLVASPKNSNAEAWMRLYLGWESGQVSCATIRKQVDFISPDGMVWLEVDGFWHFFDVTHTHPRWPSRNQPRLATVQERDAMLNAEARRRGVMLIRLSNVFRNHTGELKDEWKGWLTAMLRCPQPGVWCVGKLYDGVPWASDGCTILK
jgi:hypothetical protein